MRHHLLSMDGNEKPWTATGHERPVFLDERGRRRRWVLLTGMLAGAGATGWLSALVAGAIGFSTLPSLAAHSVSLAARTSAHAIHRELLAERPADRSLSR